MEKYLKNEWKGVLLNIVGLCIVSSLQVFAALRMINIAEHIIQLNMHLFIFDILIILGMWGASLGISYYQAIYEETIIQNICNKIRLDMALSVWKIRANFIDNQELKEIESFLQNDVNMIENKVLRSIFGMIKFMLRAILSLIALFSIHYSLFILGICLSLILYFIPTNFKKSIGSAGTEVSRANESYLNQMDNTMKGLDVLKEFSAIKFYQNIFDKELFQVKNSRVFLSKKSSKINFLIFLLNVISQLSIIVSTGILILIKTISIGALLSTTELAMKLFDSVSVINQYVAIIHSSIHFVEKIDKYQRKEMAFENNDEINFTTKLNIDKLFFGYSEDNLLFNNFNLEINKGKWYVINGSSGSGKSTLFKILLQQLKPLSGNILIDGKNIGNANMTNIFSYLRQQGHLFNTTIKDNILLGKDEPENFKEIIDDLKIDLKQDIQELSGGERQKIAIARLLVKPNPVLLLDESFSSLDLNSAQRILKSLADFENLTLVMITHRIQELDGLEYTMINI